MRVLGVVGAEVGVEEVEVLIRIFEDRRGEAIAFAWARRRRSIEYVGKARRERTRTSRLSRVCHVSRLSENYFLWELDVPFRRDVKPRCIVPHGFFCLYTIM